MGDVLGDEIAAGPSLPTSFPVAVKFAQHGKQLRHPASGAAVTSKKTGGPGPHRRAAMAVFPNFFGSSRGFEDRAKKSGITEIGLDHRGPFKAPYAAGTMPGDPWADSPHCDHAVVLKQQR